MSALQAVVYVNGTITPAEQAVVPVFDHGFLYGEGVYETLVARTTASRSCSVRTWTGCGGRPA